MTAWLRRTVLALASGILLALAFPQFDLSFLVWVALVPLLLALQDQSLKASFGYGFLTTLTAALGTVSWVAGPEEVTAFDVALIVSYLGLYGGLFGLLFGLLPRHITVPLVLTAPAIWVSVELLRAHFFFLEFPWVLLGHSQYRHPALIQIASITGVYGVSFLIMTVNVALFELIRNRWRATIPALYAGSLVSLTLMGGLMVLSLAPTGQSVTVTVIPGNLPQAVRWDTARVQANLAKYVRLTKQAHHSATSSLIVWPETAVPGNLRRDFHTVKVLSDLVRETQTPLLLGSAERAKLGPSGLGRQAPKRRYNGAFLFSPTGSPVRAYYKIKLLPFGEYLPLKDSFPWPARYHTQTGNYEPGEDYVVFSLSGPEARSAQFSVLLCWEAIFPDLARQFVTRGAEFLIAMSNEAWFSGTAAPSQFLSMNVFRAVENRRAVVRSVNGGISGFIDPYGRLGATISPEEATPSSDGFLTHAIPVVRSQTLYTLYGDVFAQSVVAAALVLFVVPLIARLWIWSPKSTVASHVGDSCLQEDAGSGEPEAVTRVRRPGSPAMG